MKRLLIALLKFSISAAIIAYLVVKTRNDNQQAFADLWSQPKNWWLLSAATLACASGVVLTHIRWYYLVRALHLPFSAKDAFRLGFLGYLFNLAPMGIVGGDLLKAVMLSRQLNGHRAKAMASVAVDRIIGLYILFVLASVAVIATRFWDQGDPVISGICVATILVTAIGGLGLVVLFVPGLTGGRVTSLLGRLPYVGHPLMRLIEAVRMYQENLPMLLVTTVMSVGAQVLFVLTMYLIACGLYDHVAPLSTQFVVVPLSSSMGVIPLSIGPFEAVLDFLYARVGVPHQGLIVALVSRIITLVIATVGMGYYLGARREINATLQQAERAPRLDAVALVVENTSHAA